MDDLAFEALIRLATRIMEVAGVAAILAGTALALMLFVMRLRTQARGAAFAGLRRNLGRSILLGLEFLVAADIINTVAIEPTMDRVLVLAVIVLIRTFLSFSLEAEIEGRFPWQRARDST